MEILQWMQCSGMGALEWMHGNGYIVSKILGALKWAYKAKRLKAPSPKANNRKRKARFHTPEDQGRGPDQKPGSSEQKLRGRRRVAGMPRDQSLKTKATRPAAGPHWLGVMAGACSRERRIPGGLQVTSWQRNFLRYCACMGAMGHCSGGRIAYPWLWVACPVDPANRHAFNHRKLLRESMSFFRFFVAPFFFDVGSPKTSRSKKQ